MGKGSKSDEYNMINFFNMFNRRALPSTLPLILLLIANSAVFAQSRFSETYVNALDKVSDIQTFLLPFFIGFGIIVLFAIFVKPIYGVILTLIVSPFMNSSSGISISELGIGGIMGSMGAAYLVRYQKMTAISGTKLNPEVLYYLFGAYLVFSIGVARINGLQFIDSIRDLVPITNLIVFGIVIRFAKDKRDVQQIERIQFGVLVFLGIKTTLETIHIYPLGHLINGQADALLMLAFLVFSIGQIVSGAKGRKYYYFYTFFAALFYIATTNRTQFLLALFCVAFMIIMVRRSRRVILLSIVAVVMFLGLYITAQYIAKPFMEKKEARLMHTLSKVDLSVENRTDEMRQCWEIFLRSPLVGSGIGYTYRFWRHWVRGIGQGYQIGNFTHSDVMFLLSKTGIIGLGLYLLFNISICRIAWLVWKKAPTYEIRVRGLSVLVIIIASHIMAQSMPVLQIRSSTYFFALLMAYVYCLYRDYVIGNQGSRLAITKNMKSIHSS